MQELFKEIENDVRPLPAGLAGETQDDVEAREDARLLLAIAGEDHRALAILYRRRSGLVFSFLVRRQNVFVGRNFSWPLVFEVE